MPTTIIDASAGSGKTYRLAVAYLQALLQPLPDGTPTAPQHVLATTFTRAAASEILERVLHRLALAVVSADEAKRLLTDIQRPDLDRAALVRLLESVCEVLPQLQVGTIDGLFNRIVRVMSLDLALPSAWSIANETQAEELALMAADRMLRGDEVRQWRQHWHRYAQFKPGLRVRAALADLLEHNRFHLTEVPLTANNAELAEPLRLLLDEADQLTQALATFDHPRTAAGKPHASWVKAIESIKSLLAGEPTLISILKGHTLLRLVNQDGATYYKVKVPASLREILGPLIERARADLRRLHDARLPALAQMAARYHLLRSEVAYALAAYTFPEIEAAAWTLPSHLNRDDLYFRLDGQIQHLLLDEFQDTSRSQFRFLWPIIKEVRANGRLFFAVGDVKQSIYGWRGADRRLLTHLQDWLDPLHRDPDLKRERLPDNRRSSPAVLRAIDRIFKNLDTTQCLNPEGYSDKTKARAQARQKAAATFISGYETPVAAGDNQYLAGRVRLLLHARGEAEIDTEEDEVSDEIKTILRAVEQHRAEDPDREIAILCRRRKLMPSILAGLRTRGISASGEGGNPVADSAAVEVVLSMLTWLDHPGHTLACEHVKRSGVTEVFGFAESVREHTLSGRHHVAIMRRGLASVIAHWIKHPAFRQRSTIHDQVRTEQLVELARRWDAAGGERLSGFVAQVRSQRVEHPASSRVRVMTIHGSKGLEFEAVILADLESGGGGGDGPRLAVSMTSPDEAPTVTLIPTAEDAELLGLQTEYECFQQNKFEEDLSVLYVALTRAKSFLDVVLPVDDKPKPALSAIVREQWGWHEAGEHLIDECPALGEIRHHTHETLIGPDAGIGSRDIGLTLGNLQTVPRRMESITPSGQEGAGVVKLGQILSIGNAPALERGTAVHALLSRIEWIDGLPALDQWIASIPNHEATPEACRIAARELHPRLCKAKDKLTEVFNPQLWLDRWKADGVMRLEVWRERRFAAIVNHDLMNGSFDRVVLGYDSAGTRVRAQILDFKTDRITTDAEREERRAYYQPQLTAYIQALHHLTGLPESAIQAELVWIN